jgi:hypothetical protein
MRFVEWLSVLEFMTPEEREKFRQMKDQGGLHGYRYVKQLYNQRSDRSFLDKLQYIHWSRLENLEKLLSMPGKKPEISCNAYPGPPYNVSFGRSDMGVMVKGWVTFGANSDMASGPGGGPNRNLRYAEPNDMVLGASEFRPMDYYHNEFLVANWKPVAIVDKNAGMEVERFFKKTINPVNDALVELSARFGLPLLNGKGERVQ